MDHVTKAKLQLRVVLVTYRQHVVANRGDADAAAAFRERSLPIIDAVERADGADPEVTKLLAEVRHELDRGASVRAD